MFIRAFGRIWMRYVILIYMSRDIVGIGDVDLWIHHPLGVESRPYFMRQSSMAPSKRREQQNVVEHIIEKKCVLKIVDYGFWS